MSTQTISIRSVSLCTLFIALFCMMGIAQDAPPPQDVRPKESLQPRRTPSRRAPLRSSSFPIASTPER